MLVILLSTILLGLAQKTQINPVRLQQLSQRAPINNYSPQYMLPSQMTMSSEVIQYPNWETWKAMHRKNFSPSDDPAFKQLFVINMMSILDKSLWSFNFTQVPSEDLLSKDSRNEPLYLQASQVPNFDNFIKLYKKNYEDQIDYDIRKSFFNSRMAYLPVPSYWSDWTIDEFDSNLPLSLVSYKTGNTITQRDLLKNNRPLQRRILKNPALSKQQSKGSNYLEYTFAQNYLPIQYPQIIFGRAPQTQQRLNQQIIPKITNPALNPSQNRYQPNVWD